MNKEKLEQTGAKYYYASVYREGNNIYTTSSRAMGIIGVASDLESAEKVAEQGVGCISGKLFYRKDIGTRKLIQKRIDHMNSLLKK
ncbi:MAG: phosphoribosylglycinamide synthetase C domain-containing protein [Promethearchaeota archaeon]